MPPPGTPSPHRFIAGARRKASPTKETRPPSSLRYDVPQVDPDFVTPRRRPPAPPAPKPPASATQFVRTPRFSHATQRPHLPTEPEPPVASFAQALRGERRKEDVEDDVGPYEEARADEDDEEMLLGAEAVPTTELYEPIPPHAAENRPITLPFSPKRRRLEPPSSPDNLTQPHPPVFKPPPDPSTLHSRVPQALRFSTPARQTPLPDPISNRPAFLRPSAAPAETAFEPLPEAFSPHRRGQKFVPGGLAATVQQWVVETGQAAQQSQRGKGYLRGEEWVMKVWVQEVGGEGLPLMVRGRTGEGESVRLMLTGTGAGSVELGKCIGVRAPCWLIEVEEEEWWVGVDWREVG